MRPLTVGIIVFLILASSFVLRWVVLYTGLLPVNDEVVLKRAVELSVRYQVRGMTRTVRINDSDELRELLAALRIHRDQEDWGMRPAMPVGIGMFNSVDFVFPNGMVRGMQFSHPTQLGHLEVDFRFYQSLCDYVSRKEGRRIELLNDNP